MQGATNMVKNRTNDPHRIIGRRYDGGKSPLGGKATLPEFPGNDSPLLALDKPPPLDQTSDFAHVALSEFHWSERVTADWTAIRDRKLTAFQSKWCEEKLVEWGYTIESTRALSEVDAMKLANRLIRASEEEHDRREHAMLSKLPGQMTLSEVFIDHIRATNKGPPKPTPSKWADNALAAWGYTPKKLRSLNTFKQAKLCARLAKHAREEYDRRAAKIEGLESEAELLKAIRAYGDSDLYDDDNNAAVRAMLGMPPVSDVLGNRGYVPGGFPWGDYNLRALSRSDARMTDPMLEFAQQTGRAERTALHVHLRDWAEGPLVLEHPQGSSFHHLIEYDRRANPLYSKSFWEQQDYQVFVVERDWARAFAGYDLTQGEAPLPFANCLFEFRISGVRVLAFYQDDDYMFCVYGKNGIWVTDDYRYHKDSGRKEVIDDRIGKSSDLREFPRVSKLVRDNVRVATIMVDAQVAEVGAPRKPGEGLVKKRIREGKPPPRAHYVVDLKNRIRYERNGLTVGPSGVHLRGHLRRGTWVHFDDPESGEDVYVDAGGFFHSRTWRRWHYAGDLNNMIEKEYRL